MIITDHNINALNILAPVSRVVSLVPSLTETIASLGGGENLAGVTRFCKYPEEIRLKTAVVGGPKDFDTEKIMRLHPDVVVAVKEENDKSRIMHLAGKIPVVLFDIVHLEDVWDMIRTLGRLLGKEKEAGRMTAAIRHGFKTLPETGLRPKCAYLIWKKPWMAAGKETFINAMLQLAGFENVVEGRYPEIGEAAFAQAEVLLLSSEPFPFGEKDAAELQRRYPQKKILPVNGEMFSWYGARMLHASRYFQQLRQRTQ